MSPKPLDPPDLSVLSPLASAVAATLARVASDIALVIDSDGVIRTVAEGGAALPSDVGSWVGRRWVDTVTADTRRKIELLLDDIETSGVSKRREVNHPGRDGDDVPMAWTAIRLGEHGPVLAVGRDLRAVAAIQRRFLDAQHEMELDYWQRRHADNRYRLLFHVARDAVMVVDAQAFELAEVNTAAHELLGLPQAVAGRPLPALLPDNMRAAVVELLAAARSSGRAGEIRVRLGTRGQACSVSATPYRVGDQRQLLVRARCADDDNDAGLPAMMRSLVESTSDAVVITDSSGRIQLANPAFIALVDQGTEAHVKGRMLSEVMGDHGHAWHDLIERTRRQGLCARAALSVRRGGLELGVESSSTILTEGEQEHLGFTIRLVEPSAATAQMAAMDGWSALSALKAQIGLVPLAALLQDAGEEVERQFLQAALNLAGGQVAAAARLLVMDPRQLSARLMALEMLPGSDGQGSDGSTPPVVLN